MIPKPSLSARIAKISSVAEWSGWLDGVELTGRDIYPLEERLLERRLLDVSGAGAESEVKRHLTRLKTLVGRQRAGNGAGK